MITIELGIILVISIAIITFLILWIIDLRREVKSLRRYLKIYKEAMHKKDLELWSQIPASNAPICDCDAEDESHYHNTTKLNKEN